MMMQVEIDEDQNQSVRFSLPTLGIISSVFAGVIFCGGWIFGYMTFKADMALITSQISDLKLQTASIGIRLNALSEVVGHDRENLSSRLQSLESEVKFISQGVAELKLKAASNGK